MIVVHVGGLYGDANAGLGRWIERWDRLPTSLQQRLVLEHEDDGASLGMVLRVHAATGVPVVFDHLHWCLNNPEGWPADEAMARALGTWPAHRTPKIHFSSQRTELQAVERVNALTGRHSWRLRPPRPGHHADFVNCWEFAALMRSAAHLRDFDVMLEAKAGDLALVRLRQDLERYVPDVAAWLQQERRQPSALFESSLAYRAMQPASFNQQESSLLARVCVARRRDNVVYAC